jgi:citrate lyase synthetase
VEGIVTSNNDLYLIKRVQATHDIIFIFVLGSEQKLFEVLKSQSLCSSFRYISLKTDEVEVNFSKQYLICNSTVKAYIICI